MMFPPPILAAEDNPLGHVLDKALIPLPEGMFSPATAKFLGPILTMNTLTMIIASAIMVWALITASKSIHTGPDKDGDNRYITKGRFAQMIEVVVLYLRDSVIRAQLGREGDRFAPFLLTVFFFILFNNLLGLVPLLDLQHLFGALFLNDSHFAVIGGTATGRIAVTGALAVVAFILWQVNGLRSLGLIEWCRHFTAGAPWYLWWLMVPVEIMSMFVKPFALAIRLFANMTAGHVLLAVLMMFTAAAPKALGLLAGGPIGLISAIGAIGIFFLEILVAFLQAFIFLFLTTVFIAQLVHHHDEHAESHTSHEAEPHPAPAHA